MGKPSVSQQSVLYQYLSLMLIILSFLVGAANSQIDAEPQSARQKNAIPKEMEDLRAALNPELLKSEIPLPNFFSSDGDSIDSSAVAALHEILENHNLDVQFEIISAESAGSKCVRLARVLRELGFWKDSFTVVGTSDPSVVGTQVSARLVRVP